MISFQLASTRAWPRFDHFPAPNTPRRRLSDANHMQKRRNKCEKDDKHITSPYFDLKHRIMIEKIVIRRQISLMKLYTNQHSISADLYIIQIYFFTAVILRLFFFPFLSKRCINEKLQTRSCIEFHNSKFSLKFQYQTCVCRATNFIYHC